ncbi:MAG: hypothetical protein IPJ09_03190 [Saprospiraceae bacterium]|nr:hypothetical protein [Saprospiraceae bacterium]
MTSHVWVLNLNKDKNALVFSNNIEIQKLERRISRTNIIRGFFQLLIICLGFFKFFWFYSVYQIFDATALFIFVCYMLAAVLHVLCTGYFFFTLAASFVLSYQHSLYLKSNGKNFHFDPLKPMSFMINTSLDLTECNAGRHSIQKKGNNFYFEINGILLDSELNDMIGRQLKEEQQQVVAIEGVRVQYNML